MKSPWKMIGQLIFRRRSPEDAQDLADEDVTTQEHLAGQQDTSTSSLSPLRPIVDRQHEDIKRGGDMALEQAIRGEGAYLPNPITVAGVAERQTKKPKHGRARKRASETMGEIAGTLPVTKPGGRRQASTEPAKETVEVAVTRQISAKRASVFSDVADVDAEIRVLARQLAEKLKQQNAQLHKMLERFGGHTP